MEKNRGYLGDSCSALEREPERDMSISISICGVPYVCTRRVLEKGVGVELAQPSRDHRGTFNAHPMYTVVGETLSPNLRCGTLKERRAISKVMERWSS